VNKSEGARATEILQRNIHTKVADCRQGDQAIHSSLL
jgi:hypothetical protein